MKHGLNVSLKTFMQVIEESMTEIVNKIQEHDFNSDKQLTIKDMVQEISADTGLPPQLLQLAASEVINESTTHFTLQGRYGGVKMGERPAPRERTISQKAQLRQQIQELENELKKFGSSINIDNDGENETNESFEKELMNQLDSVE